MVASMHIMGSFVRVMPPWVKGTPDSGKKSLFACFGTQATPISESIGKIFVSPPGN